MESKMDYGQLWADLEVAVRRYKEHLPVDDFLPDPEERVRGLMQERMKRRRSAPGREHPTSLIQEETLQESAAKTEIDEPSLPVNETRAIEKELRNKFAGNSFAELEDV